MQTAAPEDTEVSADDATLKSEFARFVGDPAFPCLGAKAAFNSQSCVLFVYDSLGSSSSAGPLARDLQDFVHSEMRRRDDFSTFIAIFRQPRFVNEEEFENLLWMQLQRLHRLDLSAWDASVASDPADSHFSFSFAGQALYVVGLHSGSSRLARRFPWPVLVFNPHEQFERLRQDGKWRRIQETIRARDVTLQGNTNPMLSDFGEKSEARQYSGRAVDEHWRPPFEPNPSDGKKVSSSRCPFAS